MAIDNTSPLEEILDKYPEETFTKMDGLDDAIIGVFDHIDDGMLLVYSENKIIKCLIEQGMTRSEAWEFYDFNIKGAYIKGKPLIVEIFDK